MQCGEREHRVGEDSDEHANEEEHACEEQEEEEEEERRMTRGGEG
jgi:hypothetical protein